MFKHLLVPVDGSDVSKKSLKRLLNWQRPMVQR
jgi:nucleotide-binding universal stress UspA family protein